MDTYGVTVVSWIGDGGMSKTTVSPYDEAMEALSSLITKRSRADKSNKGDRFDLLFDYVKVFVHCFIYFIHFPPKTLIKVGSLCGFPFDGSRYWS